MSTYASRTTSENRQIMSRAEPIIHFTKICAVPENIAHMDSNMDFRWTNTWVPHSLDPVCGQRRFGRNFQVSDYVIRCGTRLESMWRNPRNFYASYFWRCRARAEHRSARSISFYFATWQRNLVMPIADADVLFNLHSFQ